MRVYCPQVEDIPGTIQGPGGVIYNPALNGQPIDPKMCMCVLSNKRVLFATPVCGWVCTVPYMQQRPYYPCYFWIKNLPLGDEKQIKRDIQNLLRDKLAHIGCFVGVVSPNFTRMDTLDARVNVADENVCFIVHCTPAQTFHTKV